MTHIDGGVTGTLRAEARDDQSAENLRQVVQGLLALGRMQNDPKATAMLQLAAALGHRQDRGPLVPVPSEIFDMIPKGPGSRRHGRRRAAASGTAAAACAAAAGQIEK